MKMNCIAIACLAIAGAAACVTLFGAEPVFSAEFLANELLQTSAAMGAMLPGLPRPRGIVAVRADASGDIKALLGDLNKDFETFKATMSEKDREMAKKFDDVVTTEKLERVNSSVSELQAAVDQANAQLAAMSVGAGGEHAVKDKEYTEAFRAHFSKGEVQAALNKGADDEGGYLAPVEWDRTITDALVEVSPMRQIAQIQNISTAGFKKLFNNRGMGSGWVGETAARPQTNTPDFSSLTFTPGEIYANPAATQQMLDDAEVNLEAWMAGEVETEFSYQEGLAFVAGDGVNKPRGFLTYVDAGASDGHHPWGNIPTIDAAAAAAIDPDELFDMIYSLPGEYTSAARFVMNRTSQGTVRKLKDGQGNYLWQPSFAAGQPATLAAYPITEMPAMPDVAAGAIPIAFGDFRRGYLIVDRVGVRVLRDPYTNKPYVHFYTTKRVGGGVQDPTVMRLLKMAAV
ncbi:phage major capsid protein [Pararhizobium haloflavum]|uniref:phage major capsid protein n=1 Tax=Pararhizobium haloflavum TaxID=2037914 RepID=UPI000C1917E1|nr:phage major capsid protein [Pararhizobium haloflavum]